MDCKVEKLKLAIFEAGNDTESESGEEETEFQLSDRVFVQEGLVSLKLAGWEIRLGSEVTVLLPVLRKLCLDSIILVDNPTFVTMIGSCPLLEELAMVDIVWQAWESCFVASSSLKSLKITWDRDGNMDDHDFNTFPESVSFYCPNLLYLEYTDYVAAMYPIVTVGESISKT